MVSETMAPPPLPTARRVFVKPHLVAAAALLIGIGVDTLALRRPIGVGAALAMLIGLAVVLTGRSAPATYPTAFKWLVPSAMATAIAVAWRASSVVVVMNLFGYAVIIAIAVRLYDSQPLKTWTITDYVWRGGTAAAGIVGDAGRFLRHDASALRPAGLGRMKPYAIGLVAALPILLVFLALFISADAVFADYVSRALSIDVELARFVSRMITSVMLALVAVGSWRAVRSGFGPDHARRRFAGLPRVPVVTGLTAVAVLFATFVAVQVRYLFGGADVLDAVGITYSEYARRGFFEMVAVAFLMVVLLTVADWLVESGDRRWRPFDIAAGSLVALTLVIVASAAVRMRLYTAEFGLTELRFYTSVFMGWTSVVLVLVPLTVLAGKRGLFAFGLLISGLAFIGGVTIANPDAVITHINLDRGAAGYEVDYEYLGGLSPDAVPALAAVAAVGDTCAQFDQAAAIVAANDRSSWGWRSATWSHRAAAAALLAEGGCS